MKSAIRTKAATLAWKRRRIGRVPDLSDFMEKVHKHSSGCWLWTGAFFARGYGSFNTVKGGKYKAVKTNRQSWIFHRGEIPEGKFVLHTCDNKACVNPEHLYIGDHAQNMRDAVERKQMIFGERNPNFVRFEGLVDRIKNLNSAGISIKGISDWLNIGQSTCKRALAQARTCDPMP